MIGTFYWNKGRRRENRQKGRPDGWPVLEEREQEEEKEEGREVRVEEVAGLPRGEAGAMEGKQLLGEREVLR